MPLAATISTFLLAATTVTAFTVHYESSIGCRNGFCYHFYHVGPSQDVSFDQLESFCQAEYPSHESHLVSIHSQEENSFVYSRSPCKNCNTNIGLHKVDGSWVWTDNTPFNYQNWIDPNNNADDLKYAHFVSNGKWKKSKTVGSIRTEVPFICKYSVATKSPTTPSPSRTHGCLLYQKDGCSKPSVISELSLTPDVVKCQQYCNDQSKPCQSFAFNMETKLCTLFSDKITDYSDCTRISGPLSPSKQVCKSIGCQDFYHSNCDMNQRDKVVKNVGSEEKCQEMCLDSYKSCMAWDYQEKNKDCVLHLLNCKVIHGLKQPPIQQCM